MHKVQFTSNPISSQLFSTYIYRMLVLLGFMILSLISNGAFAADPNPFESSPSSNLAECPANHKMYYIGANAPTSTPKFPVVSLPLNWTAGNTSRNFTFTEASGNKIFNISFSSIVNKNTSQGAPPFYGSINGSTSSALNLVHDSTSNKTNHILNINTSHSFSKTGYKIQDLDSLTSQVLTGYTWWGTAIYEDRTPYIEQVDVSGNNGRLTFNNAFHTSNNPAPDTSIVTGIKGRNCSYGECNIDASWGYKVANSVLSLRHNNTLNEISAPHAVGYSDFYFCLAPPKLIVEKVLNGTRVNDSSSKRDQFEIRVTGGAIAANSFTTIGEGTTTNNNSSVVLNLAENAPNTTLTYTITERVMNEKTLGDIANYDATYNCNNATTGSTTLMPTTAMTYNSTDKTRSFTLSNANYGDEITCTITNTPKAYTFSGTVYNDNGGITSPDPQLIGSPYNNPNFFNGIFDTNEAGIDGMNVVKVRLNDCSNNPSANPIIATVNTTSLGKYSFSVSAEDLAGKTDLCIEELVSYAEETVEVNLVN